MRFPNGLLLAPLVLIACSSSSSSQPYIDSLVVPSTATGSNGTYTLMGTITMHDNGALITRLHIAVPGDSSIPDVTFPDPVSEGTVQVEFVFLGTAGATIDYDVSVIDANGVESPAVSESVMLQ
jgi:hypothetical protein